MEIEKVLTTKNARYCDVRMFQEKLSPHARALMMLIDLQTNPRLEVSADNVILIRLLFNVCSIMNILTTQSDNIIA